MLKIPGTASRMDFLGVFFVYKYIHLILMKFTKMPKQETSLLWLPSNPFSLFISERRKPAAVKWPLTSSVLCFWFSFLLAVFILHLEPGLCLFNRRRLGFGSAALRQDRHRGSKKNPGDASDESDYDADDVEVGRHVRKTISSSVMEWFIGQSVYRAERRAKWCVSEFCLGKILKRYPGTSPLFIYRAVRFSGNFPRLRILLPSFSFSRFFLRC